MSDVVINGLQGNTDLAFIHSFAIGGDRLRQAFTKGYIFNIISISDTDGGVTEALGHID